MKFKNGCAYLIDLKHAISPELKGNHYCYAFKIPNDKALALCFLMTSNPSKLNASYTISLPENPNGKVLLKHTKMISTSRILNTLKDASGKAIFLSQNSIDLLFKEYNNYIDNICSAAVKSFSMRNSQLVKTTQN